MPCDAVQLDLIHPRLICWPRSWGPAPVQCSPTAIAGLVPTESRVQEGGVCEETKHLSRVPRTAWPCSCSELAHHPPAPRGVSAVQHPKKGHHTLSLGLGPPAFTGGGSSGKKKGSSVPPAL